MKENYAPWAVDINSFPEKGNFKDQLKFLIGFAVLAPSGHNSQPWNFSIKDNKISIFFNKERSLNESDPERRQISIGVGCAIENLLIAADFYGFSASISYFPNSSNSDLIAEAVLSRNKSTKLENSHLIFSIPRRRASRGKYENKLPPLEFIEKIISLSNSESEIKIITDKEKKDKLADISNKAQIEVMDSEAFREELSHYIKSNFTKEKIGMPGFTLEMPAIISLIASKLIKKINMSRKTRKKDDALLKKHTPAFLIISVYNDNKLGWIKSGQVFERIWLLADEIGLSCSPLAAGVQVGDYYKEIKEISGASGTPRIFARLGYSKKIPKHSPRLSVEEVVIN